MQQSLLADGFKSLFAHESLDLWYLTQAATESAGRKCITYLPKTSIRSAIIHFEHDLIGETQYYQKDYGQAVSINDC